MAQMLTLNEQVLANALIAWLHDQMIAQLTHISPAPDLLHDLAQSNYENVCCALERVEVMAGEGMYWRVLPLHTAKPDISRADLDHLLNGMVMQTFYVTKLDRHDEPFTANDPLLVSLCSALAACGYVTSVGQGVYEWNDQIGPWLVRHGAWELWEFEPAPARDVMVALEQIPLTDQGRLSDLSCRHPAEFVRVFFAQWRGGHWHSDQWFDVPSDDCDLGLAAGVYDHFHRQDRA